MLITEEVVNVKVMVDKLWVKCGGDRFKLSYDEFLTLSLAEQWLSGQKQ